MLVASAPVFFTLRLSWIQCMSLANNGRVVLALEGGYHAPAVAACIASCLNALILPSQQAFDLALCPCDRLASYPTQPTRLFTAAPPPFSSSSPRPPPTSSSSSSSSPFSSSSFSSSPPLPPSSSSSSSPPLRLLPLPLSLSLTLPPPPPP
ncbi:unnamed protein product, partial [Protopolystoma xenopodis]